MEHLVSLSAQLKILMQCPKLWRVMPMSILIQTLLTISRARIGTQFAKWDGVSRRYRYYGEYPNQSKYIRIVMADGVETRAISKNAASIWLLWPASIRWLSDCCYCDHSFQALTVTLEWWQLANSEAIALGGAGNLITV
jgi:hypothetical protein